MPAANQIIVGVIVLAIAEALVLAANAGANSIKVQRTLMDGAASSTILQNPGALMLAGDFEPGFRAELQQNDLRVVLSAARNLGGPAPSRYSGRTVQRIDCPRSSYGRS